LSEPGAASAWTVYFASPDSDSVCRSVVSAAAEACVVVEPYSLEGIGRIAVLVDPFGARFGVMSSATA
jgi:predicted enzyme related to lactoylglutathione lyase